jgi:spore coat protein U-like protein
MSTNSKRLSAKLVSLVAFSAFGLLHVTAAHAGSASADLGVGASVAANCTISAAPISFGAYDAVSANASAPLDGTGSVSVLCTNGASASIILGQGGAPDAGSSDDAPLRRMMDAASNHLAYSLFSDAAMSVAWGNSGSTGVAHTGTGLEASLTVFGRIPAGQNIPAGDYADTVVATVNF